jgi:tetratricopeptide (TPR) repeat protein
LILKPTLELSMIVRDGAAWLERCLASVAPVVDRMLIGDTGSTDETVAIARRFGAEVVELTWPDDFAAARNELLARARCDWVLVLDADEMLDLAEARALLPALLEARDVHAYSLERWDYVAKAHDERALHRALPNPGGLSEARGYPAYVPSFHTRLFRRDPRILFAGCVHEQVTDALERWKLTREHGWLRIHHFGPVETPAAALEAKVLDYHRLGLRKAEQEPGCFEAVFELGVVELSQLHRPEQALVMFEKAAGIEPRNGRVALMAALCLLGLARALEARSYLDRARALGERGALFYDTLGDCHLQLGEYGLGLAAYQWIKPVATPTPILEAKMGIARMHLGETERGMVLLERARQRDPDSAGIAALMKLGERFEMAPLG